MRFGLLTQWFDPEPGPAALPGVLARGLHTRGHDVQVLTGLPNYPTGRIADGYRMQRRMVEHRDGVTITRVALFPDHGRSFARRLANYASFGVSAAVSGTGAFRGCDAIWVNYSPVSIAVPMWATALRWRIPLVVHVADLWPDTLNVSGFAPHGALGRALDRGLDAWCGAMYSSAARVSYISPAVGRILQDRGVPADKLAYVPMWADEATFGPHLADPKRAARYRADWGAGEDDVVVLYAGALGHAQGLETLVEALASTTHLRLKCVIAGSGTAEEELRRRAADRNVSTVSFIGRVPPSEMPHLMAAADACFVGLRPDTLSAATMPSKTQATLAAGKALIVAADGDVRQVVADSGAGWSVSGGDHAGLAAILTEMVTYGRSEAARRGGLGRSYYEREFAVGHGVERIERLLMSVAAERGVRGHG